MKKLTVKELVKKSVKELVSLRKKTRRSLYDMKLKNSLRALSQTHLIKVTRKNVARINTAISQKASEVK